MNLKVQSCGLALNQLRKMSLKSKKITLSEKLAQKIHETQLKDKDKIKSSLDIEDTIAVMKSEFFSPLQTRQQRKALNKPINKIRDLTNVKRIKTEKNDAKPEITTDINLITNSHIVIPVKANLKEEINSQDAISIKNDKDKVARSIFDIENGAGTSLVDVIWEPKHWKTMIDNIRLMRANVEAPVDTMGCHNCQDVHADRKTQRFQILVSLMLSSQTKDEVTFAAVERLRGHDLKPEIICNMDTEVLEKLIHPVGFYKTKAKHLKLTSRILVDEYESDIPRSIIDLVKLPGVGPKMAHLCMSEAWNEITGIGVDVHVHRISNRLNWVPKPTKDPEQTRKALETWIPRLLWREVNHLLVGFGQTICIPTRPKCDLCLNKDICPSAGKANEKHKTSKIK